MSRNVFEVNLSAPPRDAKPGVPGFQPRDARPGVPGFQPGVRKPYVGPRPPGPQGVRPVRPNPNERPLAPRRPNLSPADTRRIVEQHRNRIEQDRRQHLTALRNRAEQRGGRLSPEERRVLGARALTAHLRHGRMRLVKRLLALADKIQNENGELAERLRKAAKMILAARVRVVNGKPQVVCAAAAALNGLSYPGATYDGSSSVPQSPAHFAPRSPAEVLRNALAQAGAPSGMAEFPGPVVIPRFATLPGVGGAQPWPMVPQFLQQPDVTVPMTVPQGAPGTGPAASVPAAVQHPAYQQGVVARPGGSAAPTKVIQMPRIMKVLGVDAIVLTAPQVMPTPAAAQAQRASNADMGWLDGTLVEDMAGAFEGVLAAEDLYLNGWLDNMRSRRLARLQRKIGAPQAAAAPSASMTTVESTEDVAMEGIFENVGQGIDRALRHLGGALKIPLGKQFPAAVQGQALMLNRAATPLLLGAVLPMLGGLGALGPLAPALLGGIAKDLTDDDAELARYIGRPASPQALQAKAAQLLAMLRDAPNPCR